jgi:hemerythrin-like domain-containing protein
MDYDIAQQTVVENNILKLLVEGLRSALAWKVTNDDFSRKLSSVRFITDSFRGHLERLMALEEYDGYMDRLGKKAPQLTRAVSDLKREHETFRTGIRRILHGLEHVSSTDQATFANLCGELLTLLKDVDEHSEKEADLYHEAFEQDAGGEG